jgi:hypothetical protein
VSYNTVAACTRDAAFQARVQAAAAQEAWNNPGVADTEFAVAVRESPGEGARLLWPVALSSDVEAAYASALAAANPNPGGDEAVITDGMILAHVQGNWPGAPLSATTLPTVP